MVKPENYKIKLFFGDLVSEEMITIKNDPRLNISANTTKRIEAMKQIMADAVGQLVKSESIANKYKSQLKEIDKEKYKKEIDSSEEIIKKIDTLLAHYLGKEDKRQGLVRSNLPNINSRINLANHYVTTRLSGLTETEITIIKKAEEALKLGLEKTNLFFDKPWNTYRSQIENIELSTFKDVKSFKLKD